MASEDDEGAASLTFERDRSFVFFFTSPHCETFPIVIKSNVSNQLGSRSQVIRRATDKMRWATYLR
jgi:hypothetical protein